VDRDMFYDYVVRAMVLIVNYETEYKNICPFRDIIESLISQLGISNDIEAEEIPGIIERAEALAEEIIGDNVR
jgi:hypothetical protein